MKIYTKTGDTGETSLFDGQRVLKQSPRLVAYGEMDELSSHIGLAIAYLRADSKTQVLPFLDSWQSIQNNLFNLGSHLATEKEAFIKKLPPLTVHSILELEQQIDKMQSELPPLREFILPGGHILSSQLHICRTVCRRVERSVLSCQSQLNQTLPPTIVQYLNRLSDYFFVCARWVNFQVGSKETPWKK